MTSTGTVTRAARVLLSGVIAGVLGASVVSGTPALAVDADVPTLHLVTLTGAGVSALPRRSDAAQARVALLARQDDVLSSIGAPETTYRWTTALNGFAVPLTPEEVTTLEARSDVAEVEADEVRPLAGRVTLSDVEFSRAALSARSGRLGGRGVVIGFVDSGITPDSPLFAAVPGLGAAPAKFSGACAGGEGWPAATCGGKIVGAGWWVEGFGADRIRSSESLSAIDAMGHGTQVASVAAGNSDVSVLMDGRTLARFSGVAPQARVAPYKACWAAPDPADDGCSTADLVSAIDQATADRVDVLNVPVAGPTSIDAVERALLGAAEADIVVIAAAGNAGRTAYAAHASPWVTTVGAARGNTLRGQIAVVGGPDFTGASRAQRRIGPLRLVLGADVAAAGVPTRDARRCLPGSLDARRAAGHAVVCLRGGIGRVDKSKAVAQSDGVAMVLVNDRPSAVIDDFHAVPTVHLTDVDGARLIQWVRRHDHTTVRLGGVGVERDAARAARWSAPGDPRSTLLKPDVVALGEGVLGAVPDAWALFSGTSAASARVSGLAALLRARHQWSAPIIRSVLTTTAMPLTGASTLSQGAGRAGSSVPTPGLALAVRSSRYRQALEDHSWRDLNVSSVSLRGGGTTTRRVTNLGDRAEYFSAQTLGFTRHRVRLTPVALRLDPGESATVRITVTPGAVGRFDDGWIVWRGARGSLTRIPVAISR